VAFWLIGMETRGRTISEIDAQMDGVAASPAAPAFRAPAQ
jgi:hypothetical protein